MDEQLKFIIEQLEKHEINYWVDSGTLLGLVRDGKLIEGDSDIDVGIFDKDTEKMQLLTKKINEEHKMNVLLYSGRVVKYKIFHGKRTVDINVFRKIVDHCWSIQNIGLRKNSFLNRLANKTIMPVYRNKTIFEINKFPVTYILRFGCWWIPLKYFEKTDFIEIKGIKIKVPFMKEEYLEKRYGNWKVPNPKWNFIRDDGLLLKYVPTEIKNLVLLFFIIIY